MYKIILYTALITIVLLLPCCFPETEAYPNYIEQLPPNAQFSVSAVNDSIILTLKVGDWQDIYDCGDHVEDAEKNRLAERYVKANR